MTTQPARRDEGPEVEMPGTPANTPRLATKDPTNTRRRHSKNQPRWIRAEMTSPKAPAPLPDLTSAPGAAEHLDSARKLLDELTGVSP
jgi:hypothetical protein